MLSQVFHCSVVGHDIAVVQGGTATSGTCLLLNLLLNVSARQTHSDLGLH